MVFILASICPRVVFCFLKSGVYRGLCFFLFWCPGVLKYTYNHRIHKEQEILKAGIIMGENYLEREDYNGKEITEEEMGRGNSESRII